MPMTPVLFLVGPAIVHLEECNAGIVNHDDRWLGNALVSETQKRVRTPTTISMEVWLKIRPMKNRNQLSKSAVLAVEGQERKKPKIPAACTARQGPSQNTIL